MPAGRIAPIPSSTLLLYFESQVEERCHWLSHVIARAYLEGRVMYDQP